jgi:hypothetical protein
MDTKLILDSELCTLGTISLGYRQAPPHKKKELYEKFQQRVKACNDHIDYAQQLLDGIVIPDNPLMSIDQLEAMISVAPKATFEQLVGMVSALNAMQNVETGIVQTHEIKK